MTVELDPNTICRKKLRGKIATNKDFALEVSKLSLGNANQNIYSMTDEDISKTLGFKHYTSIQNFKVLAKKLGFFDDIQTPNTNNSKYRIQKDIEEFIEKYSSVQTWIKDMSKRARGGKTFGGSRTMIRTFKNVCDTLEMHPDQFINGSDRRTVLDNAEECIITYMNLYMEGKAKIKYRKKFGKPWNSKYANRDAVQYINVQATRNFMKSFGFIYPSGHGGIMHQSIKQFHGKFADVRFESWNQYQQIKNYIVKHWGLDSDVFRWFAIGVEALPRADAIHGMKNIFSPVMRGKNEYYVMEVFESKTSQINGGIWEKFIRDSDTKKSIDLVKKRSDYVIENRTKNYANKVIYPQLRQTYKAFRLDKIKLRFEDVSESGYFSSHTSHALRHCGAQLWLDATNWNVAFVASMGWDTTQELIASYGKMDAKRRLQVLDGAIFN